MKNMAHADFWSLIAYFSSLNSGAGLYHQWPNFVGKRIISPE
jgi:hypothetical protein